MIRAEIKKEKEKKTPPAILDPLKRFEVLTLFQRRVRIMRLQAG